MNVYKLPSLKPYTCNYDANYVEAHANYMNRLLHVLHKMPKRSRRLRNIQEHVLFDAKQQKLNFT